MLRALVYADVDLNLIDGSSIWLSSLIEMLSAPGEIEVDVVQKTRIERDLVIKSVMKRTNVHFIDPWEESRTDPELAGFMEHNGAPRLLPGTAARIIGALIERRAYDAIIIRSIETSLEVSQDTEAASCLWVYMTDPRRHEAPEEAAKIKILYQNCEHFLCQTVEAREAFLKILETADTGKVSILPPMIPEVSARQKPSLSSPGLGYSGKFSPPYMVSELLDAFEKIRIMMPGSELHIVGDKFHNFPPVENFENDLKQRMLNTEGVTWFGGVTRTEASGILNRVHVASSWRDRSFDGSLEMSTKILEYSAQGIPVLMNPSTVQRRIFGPDYPCYVESETEFVSKFAELISSPALYEKVSETVKNIARQYTFKSIYKKIRPLLGEENRRTSAGKAVNILFSGHDFKFLKPLLDHFNEAPSYNILIDEHEGHVPKDIEKCERLLRQADIIFCEWCLGNAEWFSKHKRKGQPLVIRLHHQEVLQNLPYLARIDWRNVDRIIFICPRNMELFLERIPEMEERAVLIYNPIDCGILGLSKLFGAGFNLGFVGLAPRRKSPHLALMIFEALRKLDTRYTLFFKGKSPREYDWLWKNPEERSYYEDFYSRVKSSPHSNSIVFDPHGGDMPAWYSKIGFFLSTSEHEGSHQAVAESMASGAVPVIRNWAGASQLYPGEFVFESIDDAVTKIFSWNRTGVYEPCCERAREYAKDNFDASLIIEQYENLLNCLLSRHRITYKELADFDPELKSFSVEMDKKYFPVFIDTLRMIQNRDFGALEIFFTKGFLIDKKASPKIVSIKEYRPKQNLYYQYEKLPFSSDIKKKGFKIEFPINWADDPIKNKTWVLFFHCLTWLNDLLLEGEKGNEEAMLTSFAVIQDWIISNAEWPAVHGSIGYGDHAVSRRMEVFYRALRLYKENTSSQDKEFHDILITGILNHISILASHEIYQDQHNHGIIVDRGLLEILKDFDEFKMKEEVQSLAIRRVVAQFKSSFTAEGVHKEHSPCYHGSVAGWLIRCIDLIAESGKSVPLF
jgi:glycosyltransferase involved in cell wall biosynthesis